MDRNTRLRGLILGSQATERTPVSLPKSLGSAQYLAGRNASAILRETRIVTPRTVHASSEKATILTGRNPASRRLHPARAGSHVACARGRPDDSVPSHLIWVLSSLRHRGRPPTGTAGRLAQATSPPGCACHGRCSRARLNGPGVCAPSSNGL